MTILSPILTRRTFLGGAGASVALAAAQSAASALLPIPPLPVVAMLCETDGLGPLEASMTSQHLELQTILLAPPHGSARCQSTGNEVLASAVHRLLLRTGGKVPVLQLQSDVVRARSIGPESGLPTLLFGSFSGYWTVAGEGHRADPHPVLTRLLRASPKLYIDDLLLSNRMSSHPALCSLGPRTITGLCSPIDPAIDFASSHLRSGAIGQLKHISASLRIQDVANRLEATAIHQRLVADSSSDSLAALHLRGAVSVHPTIALHGSRGHMQIALYTARDRHDTLAVRLQHFASLARGDSTLRDRG